MLRPTKHTHPDRTVIFVSMSILKRLKKNRIEEYDTLLTLARELVSGGEFLFLPSMNFLYLLGLIQYHRKNDSFEYVGP